MLKGIAASAGIGIGRAVLIKQKEVVVGRRWIDNPGAEQRRFRNAVDVFCAEALAASKAMRNNIGEEEAAIITAQIAIVTDPDLIQSVNELIHQENLNAEYAFWCVCEEYLRIFNTMENELMRARAADILDIKIHLLGILLGIKRLDLDYIPDGSILVAEDIPPSQAAALNPQRICAIVTQTGTRYSHVSIIARALRVPVVVAVNNLLASVHEGDSLIVDGNGGQILKNPNVAELRRYLSLQRAYRKKMAALSKFKTAQTITADGQRVMLTANLSLPQELPEVTDSGCDGIGLFRTEFLFIDRRSLPGEEEQFEIYKRIAQSMKDRLAVIRTLDVGGEKPLSCIDTGLEKNPSMGCRGLRYCLEHTKVFRTQIAALLRASAFGSLQVMLPMVTSVSEVRMAKAVIEEVKAELEARGVRCGSFLLGAMIETPSAAACADLLAKEVGFFSLGTNDLTQYTLAVDRSNQTVSHLYSTLDPAVLRLIHGVVQAANQSGIPVTVCGESASDPLVIPFLIGVGVDGLSVSPEILLNVRRELGNLSKSFWQSKIPELLSLSTAQEVEAKIKSYLAQ